MKTLALTLVLLSGFQAVAQKFEYHMDEEYKMDPNGTINLDCDDAEVTITGTSRTNARVKVDRFVEVKGVGSSEEEFEIDVREKDGNLNIREMQRNVRYVMGSRTEDYKIVIELPASGSIRINGDDGEFYISNIHGFVKLNLDDSKAEIKECKGTEFDFGMDDSSLEMDGGSGELLLGLDDSELKIFNAKFSRMFTNFDDSELKIETALIDKGNYKISGGDSDLTLIFTGGGGMLDIRYDDGRVRSTSGFQELEKDDNYVRLKVSGGSANVQINVDDTDIDLVKK